MFFVVFTCSMHVTIIHKLQNLRNYILAMSLSQTNKNGRHSNRYFLNNYKQLENNITAVISITLDNIFVSPSRPTLHAQKTRCWLTETNIG